MAELNIDNVYMQWVDDNIVPHFGTREIVITENARHLFAFTIQSQVQANEGLNISQEEIFGRARRMIAMAGNAMLDYYQDRYRDERGRVMDFNRAFRLIADWSPLAKFPFVSTV